MADISHFDRDRAVVTERQKVLRKREAELLELHWHPWSGRVATYCANFHSDGAVGVEFRRGFVHAVRGRLDVLRGGVCPTCRGLIRVQMNGGRSMVAMDDPCPACHGTGRTGGVLAEIVKRNPVEVVEVTDREPLHAGEVSHIIGELWAWHRGEANYIDQQQSLPIEIWELLDDGSKNAQIYKTFASLDLARTALSRVLLLEAKQKASVPA